MTNRAGFASLVEAIFGNGSVTFDVSNAQTNKVIGALARPAEFAEFKANFEARLRRLSAAVDADENLRREVLAAVNRIVDVGWDGAYAELSALDYFMAVSETGPGSVLLDRTVPAGETLASEMGMQNANHDLSFPALGVSMDTKLLSDKVGQILEGVFKDYRLAKGITYLPIIPSYDPGGDFVDYVVNRKALLDELVNLVDTKKQPEKLTSVVMPGLSYRFAWKPGVYFGEGFYSPHDHAKRHHRLLFGHAKKFSRVNPTVITFVMFPWSGEKVFPFEDTKRCFLQEFGRNFFNDYIGSTEAANVFNRKFRSGISAGEVTRHLSGIVYLEDCAITGRDPNLLNVEASYIWNQHASHRLHGHAFEASMRRRGAYDLALFSLDE